MTEAINAHKKMAMGMTEGNVMKKGGAVKRYAMGGAVNKGAIPESRVANLPAVAVPPKMDRVMELVEKYNLVFLEDCCDALGSSYKGQMY